MSEQPEYRYLPSMKKYGLSMNEHMNNQPSRRKHITVRVDYSNQEDIDSAIQRGLDELARRDVISMNLLSATPVFRNDGVIFVTIIAEPFG